MPAVPVSLQALVTPVFPLLRVLILILDAVALPHGLQGQTQHFLKGFRLDQVLQTAGAATSCLATRQAA